MQKINTTTPAFCLQKDITKQDQNILKYSVKTASESND